MRFTNYYNYYNSFLCKYKDFFEWILVLICFNIRLREVILASIDPVLRGVSTLAYAFNRSKNNFCEICIYQGLDWAFTSFSYHFLLLEIIVAKGNVRRTVLGMCVFLTICCYPLTLLNCKNLLFHHSEPREFKMK